MSKTKIVFWFCLVAILLFSFAFANQIERSASNIKEKETEKTSDLLVRNSPSEISPAVVTEKIQPQQTTSFPKSANFILVTDVLDGFGGQRYDGGCMLSFFAGGQSSPIGAGNSPNFKLYAGFVYPAVVKCGDANGNGVIEIGDVLVLINYLFRGGPAPDPYQAGDANCDGTINIADVLWLINYLYRGGAEPIC